MHGIEVLAMLLRNDIADIIRDGFVREMNHLVYEEARRCCEGCEMDDLTQMHYDCMMKEQEEIWICHYEEAKNIEKSMNCGWRLKNKCIKKIDVYLEDSWLRHSLHLIKADDTSEYIMYKNEDQAWML